MDPVALVTPDLLLRPPQPADAAQVLAACSDPDIARWTSVPSPYTAANAHSWVEVESPAGWASGTHLVWYAVRPDRPDQVLASVGLHHLDVDAGHGELGYWAAPHARRQGVTTAAVRLVCSYAFDQLGLARIGWEAATDNLGSWRLAQRVGFRPEGTTRGRLTLRGARRDSLLAGLLPGELREVEPTVPEVRLVSAPPVATAPTAATPPARTTVTDPHAIGPVEITAGTLHLRPWAARDRDDLLIASTDPDIARWNPVGDVDGFLARAEATADDDGADLAVVDATTGAVRGRVALFRVDRRTGDGEIGCWVLPDHRGRGVGTHAVGALTRWAFAALGLTRIELFHAVDNAPMCGLAARSGFAREATLRSSYRYGDGRRHDEHLHARLATDPEPSAR